MLNNNQFAWRIYKVLSLKCNCKCNKKKAITLITVHFVYVLRQLVVRLHVDQWVVACRMSAGQKSVFNS